MTIVVPIDNSDLGRKAVKRAEEISNPSEEVVAVTAIPKGNEKYARERGWLADDEEFDAEKIVSYLLQIVSELCSSVSFDCIFVDRYAQPGQIASKIRSYAKEHEARMVVIGSDNAGRIVSTVSSVGTTIATDQAYEVMIVRHTTDEDRSGSGLNRQEHNNEIT